MLVTLGFYKTVFVNIALIKAVFDKSCEIRPS